MPTSAKKRRAVPKRASAKRQSGTTRIGKRTPKAATTGAKAARPPTAVERPSPEEEAAFTETLIASGEAARPGKTGKLPPGATHEIVVDEAGKAKVVRRRFSIT